MANRGQPIHWLWTKELIMGLDGRVKHSYLGMNLILELINQSQAIHDIDYWFQELILPVNRFNGRNNEPSD